MKRVVAKARAVRRPDTVPNPNEIAHRIDGLRERAADGAKAALKAMLEIGKLLRVMVDVHGYRGIDTSTSQHGGALTGATLICCITSRKMLIEC